jgi:hypothetical protein
MRMSPADAMQCVCNDPAIRRLSREDAILLIPMEWAHPVKITPRHEIVIQDPMLATEPLVFFSELTNSQGRKEYLQPGDNVLAHINPFDLDSLLILDQSGRFIGSVIRSVRSGRDKETLELMFRERARLSGNLGARTRHAMSPIANHRQIDKAANDDLILKHRLMTEGKAATDPERRAAGAVQGQRTAAANRLQAHGRAFDDASYSPATAPSAFDSLGDEEDLPEAL